MRLLQLLLSLLALSLPVTLCDRDFYGILGVARDADTRAIKKAYKKLSLKYHPDKATDEESKAKFVEVAEAYEVLGDEEKRQVYDQFGEEGLKEQQQGGGGGGGGHDFFSQFGFNMGGQKKGPRKGDDVTIKLPVTLKDLYLGREMEVAFQKQVLCPVCRGSGAENPKDVVKCAMCKGKGVVIQQRQLGPGFVQQIQQQCPKCNGKGKISKSTCKSCGGTKVSTAQKLESVLVERGTPDGHVITVARATDDRPGELSGDVRFVVTTQRHPKFTRSGHNLHYAATISLVEALTGFSFGIQHLDGHTVTVSSDKIIRPGQVMRIKKEGMPKHGTPSEHGDLLVTFTVGFPSSLDDKQKEEIKRILE